MKRKTRRKENQKENKTKRKLKGEQNEKEIERKIKREENQKQKEMKRKNELEGKQKENEEAHGRVTQILGVFSADFSSRKIVPSNEDWQVRRPHSTYPHPPIPPLPPPPLQTLSILLDNLAYIAWRRGGRDFPLLTTKGERGCRIQNGLFFCGFRKIP